MSIFKRGRIYWYKFMWNGEMVRESTRQTNQNVARQMEAAHRTSRAKGEVGIRDKKAIPVLKSFCVDRVEPWAKSTAPPRRRARVGARFSGSPTSPTATGKRPSCTTSLIRCTTEAIRPVIFKMTHQPTGQWTYSVLYKFTWATGAGPNGLTIDSKGHLYGTTVLGGKYNAGVAFKFLP